MSNYHKKVYTTLNYIEQFLILTSVATGCISISALTYVLQVLIEIKSSTIGLKICATAAALQSIRQ